MKSITVDRARQFISRGLSKKLSDEELKDVIERLYQLAAIGLDHYYRDKSKTSEGGTP